MDKLFNPGSVLIVGVSPRGNNMGRNIVNNLITFGFQGRIHMFGRTPGNVAGQPIHTSFDTLPRDIDVAVVLTPAATVPAIVDACGHKGIRRMVIESGGFTELADDRRDLERQLVETAARHGIRFVGPNGLGVISRATGAVFPFMRLPYLPPPGRVSVLAQSGGVGIVYLYALAAENQGLDRFASMGNKLNIDEADFIEHITAAGTSDVICLYLEDIRRGRRFYDAIRAFPGAAIVQKANVSRAGAAAARSHTASLSTDDRLVDACVRQAGAVRVQDMGTMVHYAMALTLPPVRGNRLLILSRSGGHAVIAADLAERFGFTLPRLPDDVAEIASQAGRAHVIRSANPLDLGDVFDFDRYALMLEKAVRHDQFDAIAFIHVFSGSLEGKDSERLVETCQRLTREAGKPIFMCMLTEGPEVARLKQTYGYPLFTGPEILVEAMAASRNLHARKRRRLSDRFPAARDFRTDAVAAVFAKHAGRRAASRWLPADDVFSVLQAAGLCVASYRVVNDEHEAARAAAEVGFPVAMKLLSDDLVHKSELGGVVLNVKGEAAVREEFAALRTRLDEIAPGARFAGVLVQKMVRGYREVFLGARRDPSFGPVVAVGFGGTWVETLNDISFRLCPVSSDDVEDMLSEVNLFRAFRGQHGQKGADFDFLAQAIVRLSHLLLHVPEIEEMDVNPVKLFEEGEGGVAVDARIRLSSSPGSPRDAMPAAPSGPGTGA